MLGASAKFDLDGVAMRLHLPFALIFDMSLQRFNPLVEIIPIGHVSGLPLQKREVVGARLA